MKEETKQILEIVTNIQEDIYGMKKQMSLLATKEELKTGLKDVETRLSAEIYTATTAMRDDIIALYDEDVELDQKISSNTIDFKSLYKNTIERIKNIEKHIGLSANTPSFA